VVSKPIIQSKTPSVVSHTRDSMFSSPRVIQQVSSYKGFVGSFYADTRRSSNAIGYTDHQAIFLIRIHNILQPFIQIRIEFFTWGGGGVREQHVPY
jgi:hypothetical protein